MKLKLVSAVIALVIARAISGGTITGVTATPKPRKELSSAVRSGQLSAPEARMMQQTMLEAYRFQYILSGVRHPHFASTLASLTTDAQLGRIREALASLAPVRMLEAA